MNRIEAIRMPSKYVSEPHLVVVVDGVPLDMALGVEGLVSSLLGWYHDDADIPVAWGGIRPKQGCTGYAPCLICPDDLDLSCSVVMVEVVAEKECIRWDRFGYNTSSRDVFGSSILWEPNWGSYRFSIEEYERCLAAFRSSITWLTF